MALALTPLLGGRDRPAAVRQRTAAILFVVFLAVFGAYTLYICQMVMIHGDEAQYLRVTQSLLHDGDIDLTNNLSGDVTEFHVMDVGVDRAPVSPEGKIYSLHPVGLSLLLVPAYEVGLQLWENPRLGAALALHQRIAQRGNLGLGAVAALHHGVTDAAIAQAQGTARHAHLAQVEGRARGPGPSAHHDAAHLGPA